MFYKEISEQTEPGSAFLEHLKAQIFKNFSDQQKNDELCKGKDHCHIESARAVTL